MAPLTTRSARVRTPVLDAAIAQLELIAASPLGQVPSATLLVLDRELRVRLATGAGWAELGVDAAGLVGLRLADFISPPVFGVVHAGFSRGLAGEAHSFCVPFAGGRAHWVTVQPIGDPGAVEGILSFAWDQTETRRTEEELARRLAQQSAVARFGELALQGHDVDALQAEACRLVAA